MNGWLVDGASFMGLQSNSLQHIYTYYIYMYVYIYYVITYIYKKLYTSEMFTWCTYITILFMYANLSMLLVHPVLQKLLQ